MKYLLQRVLYAVPIATGVTIICFALIYLGPVDPATAVTPDDATPEQIALIRQAYGFDRPLVVQYFSWLGRVAVGDFGASIQTGRPVVEMLLPALANTLMLALFATGLSCSLAFAFGVLAATYHKRWPDWLFTGVAIVGVSVPSYWLAIVLISIFSVELNWLPAMGIGPQGAAHWTWNVEHLRHLVLPTIAVAMIPLGVIARTTRACVLDSLSQEFVESLYARGLSQLRVMLHVVRNAAPTVLAVAGLQFGQMLGGSILVETIFAWPGSGFLLYQSIFKRDLPVLQATIVVIALFFVLINLLVDMAQSWLDPRIERV